MSRSSTFKALALTCALGFLSTGNAVAESKSAAITKDPVVFSFAFFGCNRLNGDGVDATKIPSTANEAQLLQSFQDIADSSRQPDFLFMAGDIVKAKKPGIKVLAKQLDAWVELATNPKKNPLIKKGVPMVAFTGNHELLVNQDDGDCKYAQCPNLPAYGYWQKFMKSNQSKYNFIANDNGPRKGGPDGLFVDERRLSYSFRNKGILFVILNTDSMIDKNTIGDVPLHWLTKQLQDAQRDRSINHVFVMGHKPLDTSDNGTDPGNRTIRPDEAGKLYALLNNPAGDGSPSKVRVFLAAHAHEWNYLPKLTIGNVTGTIPQIIAGNGGSPPNYSWREPDAYFGYTILEITKSGTVTAKSFGRPVPNPSYEQKAGKTTLQGTYILKK